MENPPFEDVFPIQDGDFPLLCLFTGGYFLLNMMIFQPAMLVYQRVKADFLS